MTPEQIRTLYEFNSWATHRMLEACGGLSDEQFTRNLGFSFPTLRDTLSHIMGAEWWWLEVWQGRAHDQYPPAAVYSCVAALRARWATLDADLLRFARAQPAESLQAPVKIPSTKGPLSQPLWRLMQHLVNHSSYHRGQAAVMIRQLGAKPAATDLLYFYLENEGHPID